MSLSASALRALAAAGATADMIVAVVEAELAEEEAVKVERRARDAERKRRSRVRDVTRTDADSVGQAVTDADPSSSLSSPLHPPTLTPTPTDITTRARAAKKGRFVPETWTPSEAVLAFGSSEGLTPGEIERALAAMRDHEFRDPKSDWDRTARRWLRTTAEQAPPRQPRLVHDREPRQSPGLEKLSAVASAMRAGFATGTG